MRNSIFSMTVIAIIMVVCGCSGGVGTPGSDCMPNQEWLEPTPWTEPNTPTSVSPEDHAWVPSSNSATFGLIFPTTSNSGESALSYWLTGSESLAAVIEVGLAHESSTELLRATIFVDGIQATLGNDAPELMIPVVPGQVVTAPFEIPAASITQGAHSLDIMLATADGKQAFGGPSFTALKNGSAFGERVDQEFTPEDTPALSTSQIRGRGLSWGSDSGEDKLPLSDGTLPLNALLVPSMRGDCLGVSQRVALVALLDGQQIAIGDLGVRPSALLQLGEAVSFDATITDLPMDGESHTLEFWTLSGDGAFSEGSPGHSSPEQGYPRRLHVVRW